MFMMNISFVPSICIHRSIIFILITEKKISTHFLTTIVKNLKFSLSPTVYVCVCVCVCVLRERERERERQRERELYPFPDLPTPKYMSELQAVCVHNFRFMIGLFSLFCFVLFFVCLFVCCCFFFADAPPINQDQKKKKSVKGQFCGKRVVYPSELRHQFRT